MNTPIRYVLWAVMAGLALAGIGCEPGAQSAAPRRSAANRSGKPMEEATFGAGCFWGVEAAFGKVEGVVETEVGFMGGTLPDPSYRQVCTGRTGHAEVVHVSYDPSVVTYGELLDVFWRIHNPTQRDGQGWDVGPQYRSVIFFYTPEQQAAAQESLSKLQDSGKYDQPIATAVEPASTFWRAEEYHQRYVEKHGLNLCPLPEDA